MSESRRSSTLDYLGILALHFTGIYSRGIRISSRAKTPRSWKVMSYVYLPIVSC